MTSSPKRAIIVSGEKSLNKAKNRKEKKMATKFIGYKRKNGSFTNEKTGEVVAYDNYDLYFITGGVPDITGYYPSAYKVKGNAVRQILGFESNAGDNVVLQTLHDMVNNDVLLSVLSVDDKPVVTGLALFTPPRVPENKANK